MDRKKLAGQQRSAFDQIEEVKRELLKLPNVLAVGFGMKETAGAFTEELSYRVYVSHKADEAALGAGIIPKTIGGLRTDVLTPLPIKLSLDVCGNERRTLSKHRPLKAGIAISTDSDTNGTLGWFGTLDADGSPILLTNKHVLYDATNEVTSEAKRTAQPRLGSVSHCCCCECGSDNVIGETIIGIRNVGDPIGNAVDAAIARIDAASAAGRQLRISNDAGPEVLTVSGTAQAVVGELVRKIGARSGYTRGRVAHVGDVVTAEPDDPGGPPGSKIAIRVGQIIVIPSDDESYELMDGGTCKRAFANDGDSGSVVLNADDEIVGLLYAMDQHGYSIKIGLANNIQNVLDTLSANGFAITLAVSPVGGGVRDAQRSAALPVALNSDPGWFERARDLNRGSLLHWLVERHQHEVLRLINHKRAVTVAWQRNKGPAFVAAIARSGRTARYRIPHEIEGVRRGALLDAMERALLKHGSDDLKRDMARHREDALRIAEQGQTVAQLAELLKERGLVDVVPDHMTRKAS